MSVESEKRKEILSAIVRLPHDQAVATLMCAAEIRASAVKAGDPAGRLAVSLAFYDVVASLVIPSAPLYRVGEEG